MPQKGLAKGKACSSLSIYKKINLSIDYSIQHAQLPMGNYKILEKARKKQKRKYSHQNQTQIWPDVEEEI